MPKPITKETQRKIRELTKAGMLRHEVARELGVCDQTVWRHARDMPGGKGNRSIRGSTLKLLGIITSKGYFFPGLDQFSRAIVRQGCYRTLKKHIPLRKVEVSNQGIYVLEGMEKEAMTAYVSTVRTMSMSYFRFKKLCALFGVAFSKTERESLLAGRFRVEKHSSKFKILRRAKIRARQASISDFIGIFLHSELLRRGALLLKSASCGRKHHANGTSCGWPIVCEQSRGAGKL